MPMNHFLQLALAGIQQLVPYVPGKPVEELQRELGLAEIVKLASNENALGPSPKAVEAIQASLSELHRYPDGSGYRLKTVLSERLGVSPQQITLGNGSSEILELVVRTFVTPDLEVLFSQHAFALYPLLTQAVSAKPVAAPARNFGHDLPAMLERVSSKTRLVFIANPNNPTGTLLPKDGLEGFIAALPRQVLCVLDEAYLEFVAEDERCDAISWLDRYPNLIIARTFSKAYGLAGLRVGYGISSTEIADLLNRIRPPFNNNMLALAAAEAALGDSEFLRQTQEVNRSGMLQLTDAFQKLGLEWIPSSGNFVSVNLRQPALPIYEALLRKGVIVRPVANYEMPEFLRVSIATNRENRMLIDALSQVLAGV